MIAVDLLPPEDARAAAEVRRCRVLGAVIVGVAVTGFLIAHGTIEATAFFTRRQLDRLDAELTALERPVAALRRLQRRQAALRRRLGVIAALEARGREPARLLATLAAAVPARLWLTDLELRDGRLRLTGFAADEQTIAEFLTRLGRGSSLRDLDLEEAARDEGAVSPPRRFVVAGRLGDAP